jgi:hypothetical protein
MALQLGATRDAFLAAGVPADKADAASEELAGFDNRIAAIDSRLAVLTWMVGAVITVSLLLLGSMFAVWSKLGDISGQLARLVH